MQITNQKYVILLTLDSDTFIQQRGEGQLAYRRLIGINMDENAEESEETLLNAWAGILAYIGLPAMAIPTNGLSGPSQGVDNASL